MITVKALKRHLDSDVFFLNPFLKEFPDTKCRIFVPGNGGWLRPTSSPSFSLAKSGAAIFKFSEIVGDLVPMSESAVGGQDGVHVEFLAPANQGSDLFNAEFYVDILITKHFTGSHPQDYAYGFEIFYVEKPDEKRPEIKSVRSFCEGYGAYSGGWDSKVIARSRAETAATVLVMDLLYRKSLRNGSLS